MPDPRVIFVNRIYWPAPAATAQLLTDLAEGLAARGRTVHVIAAGEDSGPHHGVTIHRTGPGEKHGGLVSQAGNYWRFLRGARARLRAVVQPGDIVVPMTDPPMLGAALAGVAQRRGARVVHWIQDIYPEIVSAHVGAAAAIPLWPLRARRDASWRSAGACVTPGADMAAAVGARGVPGNRIAIVPNWAPRELEAPPAPAEITAQRAAWAAADKFIVAYSGNLGRVHEFATLLQAAEILRDDPEMLFLFIGTGARFDEVRAAARSRKLDNVRFLPSQPRDRLAVTLAAADVHLVTLRPEFSRLVYPSKLAGILAAGRPALFVGPPSGEIARLLEQAGCGATAAPGDATRLAGLVRKWHRDPAQCGQLGRRARVAFENHFAFQAALARWDEILSQAGVSP